MKRKETAIVVSQHEIACGIYDLWLQCELAKEGNAGQFVCLFTNDTSKLLPRPISICEVDEKRSQLRLVYRVAGEGTKEFATYQKGDQVAILGVLGNGFPIEKTIGKKVLLLGGGIGIPPMLETAKRSKGSLQIGVGYSNQEVFLQEELQEYGKVVVATMDGSVGIEGTILDAIRETSYVPEVIFACGPMVMLRAVKEYALEVGAEAYLSLEERMACGVGVCLGCVTKTKERNHHSHVHQARICTEGPVYHAKEVTLS